MDILTLAVISIAGFLLGILGAIIGSTLLVLVPLLNFLGLPIHTALGTGKMSVLSRELIPIFEFKKHNLISLKTIMPFTIAGVVFSFLGTNIILSLSEKIVTIIIGLFMVIISFIILLNHDIGLKEGKIKSPGSASAFSLVSGALIGFYQGIFGGGANVFIIFAFVIIFGNTFLKAVANSKIPNLIFTVASLSIFVANGYIKWDFAVPLMIATAIGAYFGAKLAIKKGNKFIRILFVGLVVAMAIKLLFFG